MRCRARFRTKTGLVPLPPAKSGDRRPRVCSASFQEQQRSQRGPPTPPSHVLWQVSFVLQVLVDSSTKKANERKGDSKLAREHLLVASMYALVLGQPGLKALLPASLAILCQDHLS